MRQQDVVDGAAWQSPGDGGLGRRPRTNSPAQARILSGRLARVLVMAAGGISDDLSAASWSEFCRRLDAAGQRLLSDEFPGSPRERAEGYRHLSRLAVFALQYAVEFGDWDFPAFLRTNDDVVRWGGPNADNRNHRARIDPAGTYRITGNVATAYDVLFSIGEGDLHLDQFGIFAEVSASELDLGDDGSIELVVSARRHDANWLPLDSRARIVKIRQFFTDWRSEETGWYAIERLDTPRGALPMPLTPERLAVSLDEAATWVERALVYWNDYLRVAGADRPRNSVAAPTVTKGGAPHIRYGFGFTDLGPDDALVIEFAEPTARYWSVQLYSLGWFEGLDFANRQTTLNNKQTHVDADGVVRLVVAHRDPGVPNWLDTEGLREVMLIYRWVWSTGDPAKPVCVVTRFDDLRSQLPSEHPVVSPGSRAAALRERRLGIAARHRR